MLEVVSILGQLRAQGWRPLRSIVFASWDAEEYNMIGSTEWVEDRIDELRANGVAYLNVDVGVSGPDFHASASPMFRKALLRVLGRVGDPNKNKSLKEIWEENGARLEGLGAGSDYVAFQDMAGTSSIDFGFTGNGFPYHSCYETFEWMEKFGDPGLQYHSLLAQIWVLLIVELSQELLYPLSLVDYARAVDMYVTNLESYAERMFAPWGDERGNGAFDLSSLFNASRTFSDAAKVHEAWEDGWFSQVFANGAIESNALAYQRVEHNNRLTDFETNLLDIHRPGNENGPHGVPGREQFKHVIFGPQLWSGYDEAYFPFIRDAIESGNWSSAQAMVEKTASIIKAASLKLLE
jgi:N-acetylated-alpha-linked acidic dipeptidase